MWLGITGKMCVYFDGQEMIAVKTAIEVGEISQCANEQPGSDEENQRERYLYRHQCVLEGPARSAPGCCRATAS